MGRGGADRDRLVKGANLGDNLCCIVSLYALFTFTRAPRGAVDEVLVVGVCVCVCLWWVGKYTRSRSKVNGKSLSSPLLAPVLFLFLSPLLSLAALTPG